MNGSQIARVEPSKSDGPSKGGLQFGQRSNTELWGYQRKEPRWRADGNKLVHANGNTLKWNAERSCWVSA